MENNKLGFYVARLRAILAVGITLGFFTVIGILFFIPIQGGNRELMYTSIGSLGTSWIMVLSYYFGDTNRFMSGQPKKKENSEEGKN